MRCGFSRNFCYDRGVNHDDIDSEDDDDTKSLHTLSKIWTKHHSGHLKFQFIFSINITF